MKILLACRVVPAHRPGGMPHVCTDRAQALVAAGHDVLVVTTGLRNKLNPARTKDAVSIVYADCEPEKYSREYAQECYSFAVRWKPDIVHLDSFDANNPWYEKLSGPKTACTLHGFGWGAFLTEWNLYRQSNGGKVMRLDHPGLLRESKALRAFHRVIGVSRHETAMLREQYGIDAQTVYNPIPNYFFTTPIHPLPKERSYLCAAVSGLENRQFDTARKAASLAGVKLHTVSDLPRTSMPFAYDVSTALIVPTAYSQGLDLTVAEALARRRPVIASEVGSYAREAERNSALVTFPFGDVERLAILLQGPLPEVLDGAASMHKPESHVKRWLEVICG